MVRVSGFTFESLHLLVSQAPIKKATRGWLLVFIRGRITCWRLQKQEQQRQMRQRQEPWLQKREQRLVQQERLQQQELLFCRKRREQQQPRESPTGAIFSCQFSLRREGIKQFSKIAMVYTMTELMASRPSSPTLNYRVNPDLTNHSYQLCVSLEYAAHWRAASRRRTSR